MPRLQRAALVLLGMVLVSLLATAAMLQPSPRGFGTHQQLGFPPCSFRMVFKTRCPACGMTTSWAHAVRGNLFAALQANAGGTMLAALAAVFGPWTLVSGARGRWFWRPPNEWLVMSLGLAVIAVTLADWTMRMLGNP